MKRNLFFSQLTVFFFALYVCPSCNTNSGSGDEEVIRSLYNQWEIAASGKDLNKIMSFYAPNDTAVFYDAFPPREYKGTNAYRKDYENFFATFSGSMKSVISDLNVHAVGNLAYVYGIDTWTIAGQEQPMIFRFTDVLEKINGKWLIVHEHLSFPVDPVTGKADFSSKI
jgi:ketosteroid isomerase-like protein